MRLIWPTFSWIVLLLLAVPALVVGPLSFSSVRYFVFPPPGWSTQWYREFFSSRDWNDALLASLRIGASATLLSLIIGVSSAVFLSRVQFRLKPVLYALLISPLVMPTILLAIGLYTIFAPIRMVGTEMAIVVGHVVIGAPYALIVVSAALQRIDPNLERAALSLSASHFQSFIYVTVPVLRPALLSAAFMSFLASFDDVVLALFLGGSRMRTLQTQMWQGIRFDSDPTIAAVSTILLVIALVCLFGIQASEQQLRKTQSRARAVSKQIAPV